MNQPDHGTVEVGGERAAVTFDRIFDAAMNDMWDLLTTDSGLERWLAPAVVDLKVGGNVNIDFGEDGLTGGPITDLVSGSMIGFQWKFPGEPDSMIRFELEKIAADKTRLRLQHQLLPVDQAVGYGAGWHAHLDQLQHVLRDGADFDWMTRFNELMPQYRHTLS